MNVFGVGDFVYGNESNGRYPVDINTYKDDVNLQIKLHRDTKHVSRMGGHVPHGRHSRYCILMVSVCGSERAVSVQVRLGRPHGKVRRPMGLSMQVCAPALPIALFRALQHSHLVPACLPSTHTGLRISATTNSTSPRTFLPSTMSSTRTKSARSWPRPASTATITPRERTKS